jgi:hypothetical protein
MGPAAVGEPDDLGSVAELAVGRLEEGLFQSSGIGVGQFDANHGGARYEGRIWFDSSFYERKASAGS